MLTYNEVIVKINPATLTTVAFNLGDEKEKKLKSWPKNIYDSVETKKILGKIIKD